MIANCIIVRYNEIGLKGKNRGVFEKQLVINISKYFKFKSVKYSKIERFRGRIIIFGNFNLDVIDKKLLSCVFGISSYSFAGISGISLQAVKQLIFGDYDFRKVCNDKFENIKIKDGNNEVSSKKSYFSSYCEKIN